MSTRGMIGVQNPETKKVEGFYHHHDNYPTGTGVELLAKTDISLFEDCAAIKEKLFDNDYDLETFDNMYQFLDAAMNYSCDYAYLRIKNRWYGCYVHDAYKFDLVVNMICKEYENRIEEYEEVLNS